MDQAWIEAVRVALGEAAVPEDAAPMQAYVKSVMPMLGLKKPARHGATKVLLKAGVHTEWAPLRDTVLALWRQATVREERYVALDLAMARKHRKLYTSEALPTWQELVTTGAWWDLVDGIAKELVGSSLRNDPRGTRPVLLTWSEHDNMWLRRTAILSQLGFKGQTDPDFLALCLSPSLGATLRLEHRGTGANAGRPMAQKDVDFFLRKAMGWALRQYGYVNPDWVRAYVARHEGELSGLTRREALRRLIDP